ncbi:hypothetical protein DM01DRAFT_1334163 [Hesseltinella vesiculosa]|uniref:Uncharacterized protein n=1 Tax=Hesseltinella vesiculosa TaxID=101127 RepID=A0A1X2GN58_9FUNG|nr:hypothetical protein DM01DRAFT_1334163 [Hesseltinella vesiculosa]
MEEDTDSIDRLLEDLPGGVAGSRRNSRSVPSWPDILDDKNDLHVKSAEKNIVHKDFFNGKRQICMPFTRKKE